MAQGGVVMTTYKCPNCNGMVDIPEAGKVLMCKYCGTPIKPVDIFEKINSLIKSDVYSKPEPEHHQPVNQKNLCRTCNKPINNDELNRNEGVCDDCWDTAKMKEDDLS
jgi:DNA-directed RNA polymerase subunit RPC12/RpoP